MIGNWKSSIAAGGPAAGQGSATVTVYEATLEALCQDRFLLGVRRAGDLVPDSIRRLHYTPCYQS